MSWNPTIKSPPRPFGGPNMIISKKDFLAGTRSKMAMRGLALNRMAGGANFGWVLGEERKRRMKRRTTGRGFFLNGI